VRAVPTSAFSKAVRKLDRAEQILVLKTVEKLTSSDLILGKRLAGKLSECFSIRTGTNSRLRLVFTSSPNRVLLVWVGPRADKAVYMQAVGILKELEQ
jgi:mRNA-degrading endonuclease RelE of RelBE toxin-antitoxin system